MTTGTIENGRRAEVHFGDYRGEAGIVEREGVTQVAFQTHQISRLRGVTGTIAGKAYRVLSAESSGRVRGMAVLTVEPVEG